VTSTTSGKMAALVTSAACHVELAGIEEGQPSPECHQG
jgi:hypothetical protein